MKKLFAFVALIGLMILSVTTVPQADDRDLTSHFDQYTTKEVLFPVKNPYFQGLSDYYSGIDIVFNNGYVIPLRAGAFITPDSTDMFPVGGTKVFFNSGDTEWEIQAADLQPDPILSLFFDSDGLSYQGYYGWVPQSLTMGDPFNPDLDYVAYADYLMSKPELNLTEPKLRSVFVGIDPTSGEVDFLDSHVGTKARYHMNELADEATLDDQELTEVTSITIPVGGYYIDIRDDLIGKDEAGVRVLYNTLLTQFLYGVGLLEIESVNVEPSLVPHQFAGLPSAGTFEYLEYSVNQVEFADTTWVDAISNTTAFKIVDPYDPTSNVSVPVTIEVFQYDEGSSAFPATPDATDVTIFDGLTETNIGDLYQVVFTSTEAGLTLTQSRYYLIQDAFSPVILGLTTSDITIYDNYDLNDSLFLDGVSADDGYGTDISDQLSVEYPAGFDPDDLSEGTYVVTVTVTNNKGKTTEISLNLVIKDSVAPVASKDDATIMVGDDYDLTSDVTITDNKDTDGFTIIVNDDSGFRRSKAGVYDIELYVYDSDGNRAIVTFTVTVEGETVECADNQTLVDGVCVDDEVEEPDTGCFGGIALGSTLVFSVMVLLGTAIRFQRSK